MVYIGETHEDRQVSRRGATAGGGAPHLGLGARRTTADTAKARAELARGSLVLLAVVCREGSARNAVSQWCGNGSHFFLPTLHTVAVRAGRAVGTLTARGAGGTDRTSRALVRGRDDLSRQVQVLAEVLEALRKRDKEGRGGKGAAMTEISLEALLWHARIRVWA